MSQVSIIDIEGTHPQIPTQFDADIGFAIPIANTLEILGDTSLAGSTPVHTEGSGNTITTFVQTSQAIAATDATKIGLSSFDLADFTVDANGFVTLASGAATGSFNVDASTAPGTDPVVPTVGGLITVTGAQVASGVVGTNVIRTDSLAANTYTIEIQRSTAIGASSLISNGVSHFNSSQFSVDGNGFVSVLGGAFTWTDVTSATQTIAAQNGYLTDRGGGVTYTLPATAAIGDTFKIVGKLGLATITPNANQQLLMGSTSGTVGVTGTAVATNVGNSVTFVCTTSGASCVFRAESWVGSWTLS